MHCFVVLKLFLPLLFLILHFQVWFNNKGWATSASYLNAINNVILRSSLPSQEDSYLYGITAINHPMNFTSNQMQDKIR